MMFRRIWYFVCSEPGFYIALFLTIWLLAWFSNGMFKTAFDLVQLRELGAFIMAKYVTDSGLNSEFQKSLKGECKV